MSRRQATIGHLQFFGKILLKQLSQTFSHIQQHPHSHSTPQSQSRNSGGSSATSSTLEAAATAAESPKTCSPSYPAFDSVTGSLETVGVVAVTTAASAEAVAAVAAAAAGAGSDESHQKQETQVFFPFIFPDTPSFIETSKPTSQVPLLQHQHYQRKQTKRQQTKLDQLPCVSTTKSSRLSILPLSSIHHFIASTIFSSSSSSSTSTTFSTATGTTEATATRTTATTTTAAAASTLLQGAVLNFRGPSHHKGFLIILPDLDQDLVLDLTPLVESIYGDPVPDPDDQDIDTFLTICLFEEDEVPKKTWTLTIPRPVGSVLPRRRVSPGQERERRKGGRRQGMFLDVSGSSGVGGGGMGWEVDKQNVLVLRHWVDALWNAYDRWDRYRERWHLSNSNGSRGSSEEEELSLSIPYHSERYGTDREYETIDLKNCRTEPRVSSLLKSLNRLNALVF